MRNNFEESIKKCSIQKLLEMTLIEGDLHGVYWTRIQKGNGIVIKIMNDCLIEETIKVNDDCYVSYDWTTDEIIKIELYNLDDHINCFDDLMGFVNMLFARCLDLQMKLDRR